MLRPARVTAADGAVTDGTSKRRAVKAVGAVAPHSVVILNDIKR